MNGIMHFIVIYVVRMYRALLEPLEKDILEFSTSQWRSINLLKYIIASLFLKENSPFWHKYSIISAMLLKVCATSLTYITIL